MPNYEYIREPSRADEVARMLHSDGVPFGHDTETTGLDPHTDKVTLMSVNNRKKTYLIDTRDARCLEAFKPVLEDEKVRKFGFNHLFDYCMQKGTAGVEMEGSIDLMHGEMCLVAGVQDYAVSLADVTLKYLNKQRDKSLQKSFIGHKGEFTPEQLQYAAEDAEDLPLIADRMKIKIMEENLWPTWEIENQVIPAFGDCFFYGQKLDTDGWKKIMAMNEQKLIESVVDLDKFYGQVYSAREVQDGFNFGDGYDPLKQFNGSTIDINYNAPKQILYGLQMMGIQVDGETIKDTGKETQKKIQHLPVIIALSKYRGAKRRIDAYGQNFLDAIHPLTGRIHPQMWQWGTATGRPAAKGGLNVLNIPREVYFRHAFITEPDRLISTVDYAGAELRIMAEQSGDELMVRGFNSGVDFHCFVVGLLFNKENVSKKDPLRQPVKTINFGLAYGMGPGRLCASLNGEGYKITFDESKALFEKYKATFQGAIQWLNEQKQIARRHLLMTNVNGRRRRWEKPDPSMIKAKLIADLKSSSKGETPQINEFELSRMVRDKMQDRWAAIEREGANFQVQSVNVEWTKPAMTHIRKECKRRNYDARFYNTVYDETVLDVAKKDGEAVHELQKKIMIDCGNRFMKRVPVEVEGHLMPYWTK